MVMVREAARLFNSKELAAVGSGDFDFLLRVASRYKESLSDCFCVKDVFAHCYNDVSKNYKHEYYFKNLIARKILLGRHSLNTATMFNEFRVGANKADCVVLNGSSTCYEVKSEYDSLARLPEQLDSYLKLFDRVYVVTTEKHLSKIECSVPHAVGVLSLSKRDSLTEVRPALPSEMPIDVDVLMASLRKKEYLMLVESVLGEVPKFSSGNSYEACRKLLIDEDSDSIRKSFCEVLKKTRKVDKDFVGSLPSNLLVAGIEYCFSAADKAGLIDNLNAVFSKEAICITQYSGESVMN